MTAMTEQTQRTDFTDLVRSRRAELGITLRELESRSIDAETGERAKFGWIAKVEKGQPVNAPPPAVLRALAVGLQLPLRVVQESAAAQFLDLVSFVWSEDRTTRVLAARIEEMSEVERQQLADIAESFARRRAPRAEGDDK